jgi:histidine triad (HIT) family protein
MFEVPSDSDCAFCKYLSGSEPCVFVTRGRQVAVFMNRAQYERGAVLLVPNRHVETILDLDEAVMRDLFVEAQRLASGMIAAFGAVGLNMFQNNGAPAGQTIAHYHVHLVPRYPDSDSRRIFREEDYPHASRDELEARAAELRAVLEEQRRV